MNWSFRTGAFLERCRRRYGDYFTLRLLGFGSEGTATLVFVSDPAAVKRIFTGDPAVFLAGAGRGSMEPVFGPRSILLLDGEQHLRRRRLMLPPFHGERMASYAELIAKITDAEIERWPSGKRFALHPRLQSITLDVILRAVFGLDEEESRARVRGPLVAMLEAIANPFAELAAGLPPRIGPINLRAGFDALVARADRVLLDEIAHRRLDPTLAEREDILSLLVLARDDDGEPISDRELRDQLVTLLLAGHETTATALAWTVDYLLHDPAVLERLVSECRDGGREYLDAVIEEALRLRPPLPIVDRKLVQPLELDGYRLPAGTLVCPCIYLLHRREDLYPDPEAFRPERFLAGTPETYTWLPFGGGIRRCLGASFATLEMRIVLERILRHTKLRAARSEREPVTRRAIVLAPRRGTEVVLQERSA